MPTPASQPSRPSSSPPSGPSDDNDDDNGGDGNNNAGGPDSSPRRSLHPNTSNPLKNVQGWTLQRYTAFKPGQMAMSTCAEEAYRRRGGQTCQTNRDGMGGVQNS